MSKENVENAFDKIRKNKLSFENYGPIPKEVVIKAQEIIGFKLPESYVYFLEKYGNFSFGSFFVIGLREANPLRLKDSGLVYGVLEDREKFNLPDYLITINDDLGDGSSYVLDLSQMNKKDECPVVLWPLSGFKYSPHLEIISPDFGTWLLGMVEQQITLRQEDANLYVL